MKRISEGTIIWFITGLFVFYGFCLNTACAVLADQIKTALHTTDVGISIAIGSYVAGFALMQIPAGYLLDRFNPRFVVNSALSFVVLGSFLLSVANSLPIFSLANFCVGVGSSFAFLSAGVLISQWFSNAMFPILIGLIETLSTLIVAFVGYFFVVETIHHSWRDVYYVLSCGGFILLLFAMKFIKSAPHVNREYPISFKKAFCEVSHNKQIWLCSAAAALSFGVLLAYSDFWFVRVQKFYLVDPTQTALIGSMFYLGMGLGTPFLGWLSNQLKSRKLVLHLSLVLGNMALLLALYLPHFEIQTFIIIKIISFLTGFLLSGSMLFYTVVKESVSKSSEGIALSIINMIVFLFNSMMLLIPYVFMTSLSTQFFTYLWVLPFCVMISILLIYFIADK